jgi:hypothetical protein
MKNLRKKIFFGYKTLSPVKYLQLQREANFSAGFVQTTLKPLIRGN